MNPGVVEEVGSTTRTFITSLKDHPAVLVLALCNLALIVFMYFALSAAATFRTALITQSFEYQKQTAELLARCVLQPQQRSELPGGGSIE
jgi:mannose/fructose-specific phosphotransferase system component IIA